MCSCQPRSMCLFRVSRLYRVCASGRLNQRGSTTSVLHFVCAALQFTAFQFPCCVCQPLLPLSATFSFASVLPLHIGSKQDPSLLTLVRVHSVCSYALVNSLFHAVIPTLLCVSAAPAVVSNTCHSRAFVCSHWFEARSVIAHSCACAPSLLLRSSHSTISRCHPTPAVYIAAVLSRAFSLPHVSKSL